MKKFIVWSAVLCCGIALLTGCGGTGKAKPADSSATAAAFDTAAVKKEIQAANAEFEQNVAKGDSVAIANAYTTDAKFMNSNAPAIVGRKNIQSAFAAFFKMGFGKATFVTEGVWGSANDVAEEGTYVLATKDGHQIDKGKYIVLWKKDDGKWKIFRDCSNSDLPLPAAK